MSIFAEPSVTLCGHRHPGRLAVCVYEHPHQGEHGYMDYGKVIRRLNSTFTPCGFHYHQVPGSRDDANSIEATMENQHEHPEGSGIKYRLPNDFPRSLEESSRVRGRRTRPQSSSGPRAPEIGANPISLGPKAGGALLGLLVVGFLYYIWRT